MELTKAEYKQRIDMVKEAKRDAARQISDSRKLVISKAKYFTRIKDTIIRPRDIYNLDLRNPVCPNCGSGLVVSWEYKERWHTFITSIVTKYLYVKCTECDYEYGEVIDKYQDWAL
jgi:RNase P subunit RPR2